MYTDKCLFYGLDHSALLMCATLSHTIIVIVPFSDCWCYWLHNMMYFFTHWEQDVMNEHYEKQEIHYKRINGVSANKTCMKLHIFIWP